MSEEVKFTEEEMGSITELQNSYLNIQNSMGQLEIQRIRLEQQLQDLDTSKNSLQTEFVKAQTNEREFVESINKKYGDGNLDLNTGVFTPKPVEQKPDKTL